MAATPMSNRTKAATLLPIAALSSVWTLSVVTPSAVAEKHEASRLPDGSTMPQEPLREDANRTAPGSIASAVPKASVDQVVASSEAAVIPSQAVAAYQRAAQVMGRADTTCQIPWQLIAAIGRVESDHGRYGGSELDQEGIATPGIFGIRLDGRRGTAVIQDSDAGEIDGDKRFDRAVGPMQFIPGTWSAVKVDGDGDGVRNPQDIDDASLASGVYLCSGKENLSTHEGARTAVYRYNHSRSYVDLVLRIAEAYEARDYTAFPSGAQGGSYQATSAGGTSTPGGSQAHGNGNNGAAPQATGPTATPTGGQPPTPTPPPPTATPPGTGEPEPSAPTPAPAPAPTVVETLSGAAATVLCQSQLGGITDPLGLLNGLTSDCSARVTGMTRTQAAAAIPNQLTAVLGWLGL